MTLERAKQVIQENFGDKYDVEFSLAPANIKQRSRPDKGQQMNANYITLLKSYDDAKLFDEAVSVLAEGGCERSKIVRDEMASRGLLSRFTDAIAKVLREAIV